MTSPATVGVFMFCFVLLLYSAPVMFLHDSVTLISTLITIIIIIIIIYNALIEKVSN